MSVQERHPHYYKNVRHLSDIDAYRVLERFGVTDPSLQHAVKKLLVAGGRGAGKTQDQDVQEAIDSLTRFQEMRIEDINESDFQNELDATIDQRDMLSQEVLRLNHQLECAKAAKARKAARKPAARRGR